MRNVRGARMLLLISAFVVGCYDTTVGATDPADSGTDADSDSDADMDFDSDFDGDTDQCDMLYDTYSGNAITSYVYQNSIETFDSQWNGETWDSVAVLELIGAEPGDVVDLQFHDQYETCDYCVLVFFDCPLADLNLCDKAFIGTSGTVHVLELDSDQPWDNDLEFAVSDVVLEECLINWDDYESTIVPSGEKMCVGLWHVLTVPELP